MHDSSVDPHRRTITMKSVDKPCKDSARILIFGLCLVGACGCHSVTWGCGEGGSKAKVGHRRIELRWLSGQGVVGNQCTVCMIDSVCMHTYPLLNCYYATVRMPCLLLPLGCAGTGYVNCMVGVERGQISYCRFRIISTPHHNSTSILLQSQVVL